MRYIVITSVGREQHAVGPYLTFAAASADADAWGGIVLSIDAPDTHGFFRSHRCVKCRDGTARCPSGEFHRCDQPVARNE